MKDTKMRLPDTLGIKTSVGRAVSRQPAATAPQSHIGYHRLSLHLVTEQGSAGTGWPFCPALATLADLGLMSLPIYCHN